MNDNDYTITIGDQEFSHSISTISSDYTFSIDNITSTTTDNITITTSDSALSSTPGQWILDHYIDPEEVENMCKEYPALTKVWRNFKSVYDMTLQDYKGKKEAGEINDPYPF